MTRTRAETQSETERESTPTWYELSRKILLASIGAAALAKDEIIQFINRLVEKGELVERDARRLIQEVLEERERLERERKAKQAETGATSTVTKADIEALNAKITELQKRIEELRKQQG
ncbi:MAG: phasin family protein [Thermanaerothrix sp.]|uniref:phasin family protein n=1 Tax=Thermanaerothrix sp. TaxID=2972675 RepID=UPI003C7E9DD6